jgi:uncharacterized Zn finger protein
VSKEYSIEATVTAPDAWTSKCSCPVGVEGRQCKHVACLLFAFQELQTGVKVRPLIQLPDSRYLFRLLLCTDR